MDKHLLGPDLYRECSSGVVDEGKIEAICQNQFIYQES